MCSAGPPSLRLLPNSVRCLNCAQQFDYRGLGSSRKLGGVDLIDGSEKRICRLSFEFGVRMLLKGAVKIAITCFSNIRFICKIISARSI